MDYDTWFDYLRLLESEGDLPVIREAYEKAIAQIPPIQEKRYWRRYIYLWINYALFEELEAEDIERTREVYKACLNLIPHKKFTFAKIWLYCAHFEIRQKELASVRKILGTAIGMCPKDKLFRGYIDLEIQLREFDNCRKLYEKFLEFGPDNCTTWIKFAELESILGDVERARSIYELAIEQPRLDMPELLWKAFIDFEIDQQEYDRARKLYTKLLRKTQHVKVWLSLAQFEASIDESDSMDRARDVFEQAYKTLRTANDKEERLMLVEHWLDFEKERGTKESVVRVEQYFPKRVKQRRKILTEDGIESAQWEEFMQLVFPDDEAIQPHLKLLDMAKRWKKGQDEVAATTTTTTIANTTTIEDDVPLPESRVDDEEMNDES
jgi:crooked neck